MNIRKSFSAVFLRSVNRNNIEYFCIDLLFSLNPPDNFNIRSPTARSLHNTDTTRNFIASEGSLSRTALPLFLHARKFHTRVSVINCTGKQISGCFRTFELPNDRSLGGTARLAKCCLSILRVASRCYFLRAFDDARACHNRVMF